MLNILKVTDNADGVVIWLLEPIKWGLIVYNFRSPDYHGIAYRWVNSSR